MGGFVVALALAVQNGAGSSTAYSTYVALPILAILSRSPKVWRPASALALGGAATMLIGTLVLRYQLALVVAGSPIAVVGSSLSLFSPVNPLRPTTDKSVDATGRRAVVGVVAFVTLVAVAAAAGQHLFGPSG